MQTKGGHYIYVDHNRSSFIFIRNGDWSQAESIKVSNAQTKEPLTSPEQLEMCIAKFSVGFETIENDWTNRIQPLMETRADGASGTYDHLMLSLKFKTGILYGPWNAKESSSGYTPSAWRRGARVETGPIWGHVGGLQGINWNSVSKPDFGFIKETAQPGPSTSPGPSPGPGSGPTPPFAMPTVNVNLGGIKVDLGGIATTTHVNIPGATQTTTTAMPERTQTTSTGTTTEGSDSLSDDDAQSVGSSSGSTIEESSRTYGEWGSGENSLDPNEGGKIPPQPPGPPPSRPQGAVFNTISNQTLQQILRDARMHTSTVWDNQGHHEGNLGLIDVIRNAENGTWEPTIRLPENNASTDTSSVTSNNNDDSAGATKGTRGTEESAVDNRDLLSKVRAHLDSVYPKDKQGNYLPNGTTLGNIISGIQKPLTPTQPETYLARRVMLDDDGNIVDAPETEGTNTTETLQEPLAPTHTGTYLARKVMLDDDGNIVDAPETEGTNTTEALQEPLAPTHTGTYLARKVTLDDDGNIVDNSKIGEASNSPGSRVNLRATTSGITGAEGENNELQTLLQKIRSHIDTEGYSSGGTPLHPFGGNHIGNIIRGVENSSNNENLVPFTTTPGPGVRLAARVMTTPTLQPEIATSTSIGISPSQTAPLPIAARVVHAQPISQTATSTPVKGTAAQATLMGPSQTTSSSQTTSTSTTESGVGTESVTTQSAGVGTEPVTTQSAGVGTEPVTTQSAGVGTEPVTTQSAGVGTEPVTMQSTGISATPQMTSMETQTSPDLIPVGGIRVATISMVRNAAGRALIVQQGSRSETIVIPPRHGSGDVGPQLWAAARQVAVNLGQVLDASATSRTKSQSPTRASSRSSSSSRKGTTRK
ncbi:hypothetical protein Cs308_0200 [Candidatus Chlamydia sanziniae]|uniref:DUF1547 domain-containing protein n=2 Tax=Candidatus Chlamydia sanziniae TaxID=1806891 RepID=A0A1A9HVE1_9CHLA|nr:hypothetical protein Cs308_0200 [Candidatus Chlamydia sanziniae]